MKNSIILVGAACLLGCSQRSPYDITADQVQHHVDRPGSIHGTIDPNHLPPGAVKDVKVYHKGDVLPDGTVSQGDRKLFRITMTTPGKSSDDVVIRAHGGG
jgi:hypothetical protein